jgi:hypothetical protein
LVAALVGQADLEVQAAASAVAVDRAAPEARADLVVQAADDLAAVDLKPSNQAR